MDLQNRLYDYQLYLSAPEAAEETSVREHTEMSYWTLSLAHTQQVPQLQNSPYSTVYA